MNINQLYTLLYFILVGIIIGILFDIFKVIRKCFKTSDFIIYIHDFLFWILAATILLFSIFMFNNGELRAYIFIGIILGIIVYLLIFSKYLVKILVNIIDFFKRIIAYPIKLIKKYLISPINLFIIKIKSKFKIKLQKNSFKLKKKNNLSDKIQ